MTETNSLAHNSGSAMETWLGPVSATLVAELSEKARKHGTLVWLDKDGTYTELVDALIIDPAVELRNTRDVTVTVNVQGAKRHRTAGPTEQLRACTQSRCDGEMTPDRLNGHPNPQGVPGVQSELHRPAFPG